MTDGSIEYEQIMQQLDQVMMIMEAMHTPSLSFGTGVAMYRREIHTIQAIGRHSGINVTALAEYMGVTKGAVSQTIKKLIEKGLARKTHTPGNAKKVVLELTDLGWIGFHNHEKFHMDTFDIAREHFGNQLKTKLEMIKIVMTDLNVILSEYEKRIKTV
jgi:DNA-binding MarR family transcriptional regulator